MRIRRRSTWQMPFAAWPCSKKKRVNANRRDRYGARPANCMWRSEWKSASLKARHGWLDWWSEDAPAGKTCLSQPLEVQAGQFTQGGKLLNRCATDEAVLSAEIETGEAQFGLLLSQEHHKAAEDVGIDPALLDFGGPAELACAQREGQPSRPLAPVELVMHGIERQYSVAQGCHAERHFDVVAVTRDALGAHVPDVV